MIRSVISFTSRGTQSHWSFRQAAIAFRDAVDLDPGNKLVFDLYRAIGDAQVLHQVEREELPP